MSRPMNPWKATGYKPGQNVVCRVLKAETDGYAVIIPKDNLPGFIRTSASHAANEEVLAQFVCIHNGRILLSPLFGQSRVAGSLLSKPSSVNWSEQLEQDEQSQTGANAYDQFAEQASAATQQAYQEAAENYQAQQDPSSQWQNPVEEQTPTKRFRLRRAIDLVMPPMDADTHTSIDMADSDLEWLITDLEGGMRTGCMKATSEQKLSRSAVLLYRGKAVGCIYGSKSAPEQRPTEESLYCLLNDLQAEDAHVSIYDLPEGVVGAMSALFLGLAEPRQEGLSELDLFNYYMTAFTQNGNTACLAINVPSTSSLCLVFVHRGVFSGAFFVEDQIYTQNPDDLFQLFRNDPETRVDASRLPQEFIASGSRFGYSLSMVKKNS